MVAHECEEFRGTRISVWPCRALPSAEHDPEGKLPCASRPSPGSPEVKAARWPDYPFGIWRSGNDVARVPPPREKRTSMKHSVPHDLGRDKAKTVAEAAFSSYKEKFAKYSPQSNWVNDRRATISFSVKGVTLNGSMEVTDHSIDMELDVPFLLRPFKGKALGVIEKEIQAWVRKAKAGEL
jgi:hypothetical protein